MAANDVLILGVGNLLRRDDGVGIKAIELLRHEKLSGVVIQDGGTDGLGLIDIIKPYSRAIIIDAVDMRAHPGTVKLFSSHDAKINIKNDALSTHGFGLAEVLGLMEQLGFTTAVEIVGVQMQDISFGEELTDVVAAKLPYIVELVKSVL